jgi:hypothetical protein
MFFKSEHRPCLGWPAQHRTKDSVVTLFSLIERQHNPLSCVSKRETPMTNSFYTSLAMAYLPTRFSFSLALPRLVRRLRLKDLEAGIGMNKGSYRLFFDFAIITGS